MQVFCLFMALWHFCQKANCITKSAFSDFFCFSAFFTELDFSALYILYSHSLYSSWFGTTAPCTRNPQLEVAVVFLHLWRSAVRCSVGQWSGTSCATSSPWSCQTCTQRLLSPQEEPETFGSLPSVITCVWPLCKAAPCLRRWLVVSIQMRL